jgi:predicted DNA-binding transcriptional regulator AlpA
MTTAQLAAHLGVSEKTIKRLRANGEGPRGFRIVDRGGSPVLYDEHDVDEWVEQRKATGIYPPPVPRRRKR